MKRSFTVVLLGLLLTACGGGIAATELDKHPEAQLRYPGSSVVQTVHEDESTSGDSFGGGGMIHAAHVGAYMDAHGSLQEIVDWYDRWLTGHGWRRVRTSPAVFQRGPHEVFMVGGGGENISGHDPTATPYFAFYYISPKNCPPGETGCPQ